jgi:CheY-like chemotaxis protein
LRNPLAPIRNAVQVMAHIPAGDPAHEAMRQMIGRQSAQLSRILDDMVDISRVTRGSLTIEHAPVDMAEVVRRAVETATPLIEAGKHTLDVDLPAKRLMVDGDADRLTQVVTNLLNNSARYTPPGGRIAVRARAKQGWVNLSVRDNGKGIDPQMSGRIFDMFVQGRDPLQRVGSGLGIGLALSRRITELHGGSLEAHSEGEHKGSEFTVRVPLSANRESLDDKRSPPEPVSQTVAPRRVLVVDDNVDAAAALGVLLQSLGHETCVVHDGLEALKMAVEFRPDIVLLDIGMPGLDGYEVARRLRLLNKDRTFRIIALTGWGQESDRQKSQEAGFDVHLVKPVDRNELVQVLGEKNGATLH